jgi:predicted nucleic acid-binding protein
VVTTLFFDTSALLKRYVDEPGSSWLRSLMENERDLLITSVVTRVEVACALARRQREGHLSPALRHELWRAFQFDLTYRLQTLKVGLDVLNVAEAFAFQHPLRAYDAMQLASAHVANRRLLRGNRPALTFLSADIRLLDVAHQIGFAVDNPQAHL